MASESIAHLAFGFMGYWLRAHSGLRSNWWIFTDIYRAVGSVKIRQYLLHLRRIIFENMQYIQPNLIVNELIANSAVRASMAMSSYSINFVEYTMTAGLVPNNVIF